MDDECIHLLNPSECGLCNGHIAKEMKAGSYEFTIPISAKYDGFCVSCKEDILVGQLIVRISDHWIHEDCT